MMPSDEWWMQYALALAERGRGAVEPNPLVGAVVVREGSKVGEGWHQAFGGPHAEIHALTAAGEAARGSTLYLTLEPCCHFGKTPPCTETVLRAGIRRVVAAMADPFPAVAGKGVGLLRQAGLTVDVGVCESEARRLNAPYLKLLSARRPWVHAKWAMTLDGKIATRTGDSKWISNLASRERVHALRGRMDAILVGIGTALADDPRLTARPAGPRIATRIVLDSTGRLPLDHHLVHGAREAPTLVATTRMLAEAAARLRERGCEVLELPEQDGRPAVAALLDELGRRRMTNLLVEGGGEVLGSFRDAGEIDEVHVFIAAKLLGGARAVTPIGGKGSATIAEALPLAEWRSEILDGDLYVHGWRDGSGGIA
jgi:diaminohydroxyphosphoribosylaminopyrimidine deaminase/5-amino-6-(5-phosphoribosylamino)uracil reductase